MWPCWRKYVTGSGLEVPEDSPVIPSALPQPCGCDQDVSSLSFFHSAAMDSSPLKPSAKLKLSFISCLDRGVLLQQLNTRTLPKP